MRNAGSFTSYNTAWIGKWHVSDFEFGSHADPTGKNGPADYGFSSVYNIPTPNTLPVGCDYLNAYPSPNGFENESTGGDNLSGGLPAFVYHTNAGDPDAGDPFDVNAHTLNIQPPGFVQLSAAAIYHAFYDHWLKPAYARRFEASRLAS